MVLESDQTLGGEGESSAVQQAVPQKLSFTHIIHSAFFLIPPQLQALLNKMRHGFLHPFPGLETAYVDVAIIRVAAETMASAFKLLIEIIQEQASKGDNGAP